jgi:glycine hydroxymethyltransferase
MLGKSDPMIYELIDRERRRLNFGLELIPSENFTSRAVLEALGSVFVNKYSEGYPGRRYYGGNGNVDQLEMIAIKRAKKLFGAEHANVQPYSGSVANLAAYSALLKPGDKVLSMDLNQGGHITHGLRTSISGRLYQFVHYGVDERSSLLDYESIRSTALKEKPKMILSGATSYPRLIDFKIFKEIADECGALTMADISHVAGLIAGGVHGTPFPFTDVVTTTTHKTLRGPRGAVIFCKDTYAADVDKAVFPGIQGGPHDNITAAKAVAFEEALKPEFRIYAENVIRNAKTLADELMKRGIKLVSNGTDNHLILIDLTPLKCSGSEAEKALEEVNIAVNKNLIPYDKRTPSDPSGIRVGTPALTTKGMGVSEMIQVAELISKTLKNRTNPDVKKRICEEVRKLSEEFPVYEEATE